MLPQVYLTTWWHKIGVQFNNNDMGLNYLCNFKLLEDAPTGAAKANRLDGLPNKTFTMN